MPINDHTYILPSASPFSGDTYDMVKPPSRNGKAPFATCMVRVRMPRLCNRYGMLVCRLAQLLTMSTTVSVRCELRNIYNSVILGLQSMQRNNGDAYIFPSEYHFSGDLLMTCKSVLRHLFQVRVRMPPHFLYYVPGTVLCIWCLACRLAQLLTSLGGSYQTCCPSFANWSSED